MNWRTVGGLVGILLICLGVWVLVATLVVTL